MKNIRETLNSALIVGGLIGMGGGTVDAVRTILSPEARQQPAITQELRSDFQVREECIGFGPEAPVCHDVANNESLNPEEAQRQIILFRRELEKRTRPATDTLNSRLASDTALVLGGEIALVAALRKKRA